MSGLFARLVQHALGQPRNLVRAAVQSPYQQGVDLIPTEPVYPHSELTSDAIAGDQQRTGDRLRASTLASRPGTTKNPDSGARSIDQRSGDRSGRHGIEDAETGTPTPPSEAVRAEVSASKLRHDVSLSGSKDVVSPVTDGNNSRATARQERHHELASPSKSVAPDPFPVNLIDESLPLAGSDNRIATGYPPIAPGALVPLLPAVASAPAPQRAAASRTHAAVESPNEVQVHIGRIEVTAVQSPDPPKRKPGAARQPLSLDDYLADRQRS